MANIAVLCCMSNCYKLNIKFVVKIGIDRNMSCPSRVSVSCQRHVCAYRHYPWIDSISTLRPRKNGRHYPDDVFKYIFLNENEWNLTKISLKCVPNGPINNPALVQIMAWCRPGDKPLSETMMVSVPTHICVTRPQWVRHKWRTTGNLFNCIMEPVIKL